MKNADYSIKSTPLYYGKSRGITGGTFTKDDFNDTRSNTQRFGNYRYIVSSGASSDRMVHDEDIINSNEVYNILNPDIWNLGRQFRN